MTPRLCIAIVGAGIGGLAAAIALAKAGHVVQIFDQFVAARPIGSGLVIQPVGLDVLDKIGVGNAVRAGGQPLTRMLGREAATGACVLDVRYQRRGHGRTGLAIHRASLFDALWQAVQAMNIPVLTAAKVLAAPLKDGKRSLILENAAETQPFDLIVDASGVNSPLSPLIARALPYGAVWGTVPWPTHTRLPKDQLTQRYRRASKMAGVLPIGSMPGETLPMAAVFWSLPLRDMVAWHTTPLADWKAEVTTLWPDMAAFLTPITRHDQMTPARYSHGTLRKPFGSAIAFIGDAAHRASPQLGQGANMALLDALALSLALDRTEGLPALAQYAQMRRWHVRLYQGMSAAFTPQYQSDSRILPLLRDYVLAPISRLPPAQAVLSRLVAGHLIPPLAGVA